MNKPKWQKTNENIHFIRSSDDYLTVVVKNNHPEYPGKWIMICFDVSYLPIVLSAKTLDDAKTEALNKLKSYVNTLVKSSAELH